MPSDKSARANRRSPRTSPKRGRSSGSTLLLGILLGLVAAFACVWLLHRFGQHALPSSVAGLPDQPPSSLTSRHAAAKPHSAPAPPQPEARAPDTAEETAPFGTSEDVFESGARLYSSRCAICHGTPRHSAAATHPTALQLWQPNTAGGTGVSHQTPTQIHRSIAEGHSAAGMPAYRGVLTSTQIWQLSLLLKNAGQELPDPVLHQLDTRSR